MKEINKVKTNDQKIKESEEKFHLLFNTIPDAIYIIDQETGKIVDVNKAAEKMYGYSRKEWLQMKNTDVSAEPEKTKKATYKLPSQIPIRYHKKKDGTIFPLEMMISSYTLNDQRLIIATGRKITERKKSEEELMKYHEHLEELVEERTKALKESEEKHRYFFNNAQVGLFWSRISDGKILECNDTFAKLVGYDTREECLADYIALDHYVDSNKRDEMLEEIRINNEIKDFEIQFTKRDDTPYWASISSRTNLKENRIEGAAIDITGRKKAEQKLNESEIKYHHLFETSPYFIGLVNSEGILIECNDAINIILSTHTIEDVIGKNFKEIFLLNVKNTRLIPIFEKYIKSIFEGVKQEPFDFRLNRAIGGHVWIHVEATLIEIEKQKLIQFIMQDITERKRSEQLLRETIEDLAKINTELERFAYVTSHDLKEPLRMIISFIQLLEKRYKDKLDEDANDFIAFIVDGAKRMQDLINSILKYSRIGKHIKKFENVDLNDILKFVIDNLKQQINETNAEVTYDPLPTLMGNKAEFLQLLQNLISNAIKFHKEEEPPVVHISAKLQKNQWIFSVRDNGIGIDPKDFKQIFNIFQRLHAKDKFVGTGIGLAICKKIIELYSGKIWVESEVGKGSIFYFSIPKYDDKK